MSEIGLPSPVTVSALLIAGTILHGLGLISTSFRLWFRYRTRRLWRDDFWVLLTLICNAVCIVATWTFSAPLSEPYTNYEALPTPPLSQNVHVLSIWLIMVFYTCAIWFARISIVCSIVRIVPPSRTVSAVAFGTGVVFFCMWVYMVTCKVVVCATNKSWYYDGSFVHCPLPTWVAVSEVSTDTLSDLILVVLPLRLLWRVKLPSNQRIMILSLFSASILVSVVSAVHAAYIIPQFMFIGVLTAGMESAISLIACNLLVSVTLIYRVIRNGRDLAVERSNKHTDPSNRLTTVDLDFLESSLFLQTGFTSTETNVMIGSRSDGVTSGSVTTGGCVLPDTSPG